MVHTTKRQISTRGQGDAHDVTGMVAAAVQSSGVRNGIVNVAVVGSTAGVTTIEFESGVVSDLANLLEYVTTAK